jgi:hypothetical protein
MGFLHIANTNFEDELQGKIGSLNSVLLQLQFLPLLYADPEDGIGVTHWPVGDFKAKFHLLSEKHLPYQEVKSWGASKEISKWAKERGMKYPIPPWEVVRKVNSKEYSFNVAPKLAGAQLLHTPEEIAQWISVTPGPKVLKSCFGVSGRGHAHLPCNPKKIEALGLPAIGEPWVERTLDFSTQWNISEEIEFLGATICVCDQWGKYRENWVGNLMIPHLDEHKDVALPILEQMKELGFFGNVGIDAFIYDRDKLHPVVEINARKTMGYVALKFQHRHFPKQTIALKYISKTGTQSLLPQKVVHADGTEIQFQRQLFVAY